MTRLLFQLTGSLEKVLPDREPAKWADTPLRGFSGETISLQLAYFCENDDLGESDHIFRLHTEIPQGAAMTVRRVELVPCSYPCHGTWDDNYLDTRPGLYPDLLRPMKPGEAVKAVPGQWRALWLDIDAPAGLHSIALRVEDAAGAVLWTQELTVEVLAQTLPPQELIHTQWFHADCLADYYHVDVFSEEHWRLIDNFMASAVRHGINMLLTPVFTPPLDTAKGGERTTVQLVGVQKRGDEYAFDFSKLDRWIGLCEKNGVRYLEISHLFTQWGAICAPKIMGSIDGGPEEKLFGWHTPAVGGEYTRFLGHFLPALKKHLALTGWLDRTFFHISDEPHIQEAESYAAAKATVKNLLADCQVVDALSSYDVYKMGLVEHPIVSVDHINTFVQAGVPHLWAYYCTAQAVDTPNRFIAMPSARSRIMGVLMYYYGVEGFLHWGFNFYNSQCSVEHINPFRVTDAGEAFPSGDPFLVYPAPDGTAWESIRGMVIRQSLNDLRALKLLEEKIGCPAVRAMLEDLAGGALTFTRYPRDSSFFEVLRSRIYKGLAQKDRRDVYFL